MTYMLLLKYALKLVEEIILYGRCLFVAVLHIWLGQLCQFEVKMSRIQCEVYHHGQVVVLCFIVLFSIVGDCCSRVVEKCR